MTETHMVVGPGIHPLGPVQPCDARLIEGNVEFERRNQLHDDLRPQVVELGCCWALMALLFVGGVMNLWWIAGMAGIVAAEKLAPHGWAVSRATGVALVIAGLWVWAAAW